MKHVQVICPPVADIMVTQAVRTIVAVDVSAENNNNLSDYGDHISGWYLMMKKYFPFGSKVRVSVDKFNFTQCLDLYFNISLSGPRHVRGTVQTSLYHFYLFVDCYQIKWNV